MFKILIVEDDPQLNHSVCSHLLLSGYEVAGCQNVHSAYDAMYGQMFDLIISDVMMPGIVIGLLGILGVALAYPLYLHITKRERARIAPEILRLSDELIRDGKQFFIFHPHIPCKTATFARYTVCVPVESRPRGRSMK